MRRAVPAAGGARAASHRTHSEAQVYLIESARTKAGDALRAQRQLYFSLIGGAIFSAGAWGSAGLVAAPCVCGSGRAGSGAGVVGRWPPGLASAGVLF